MVALLYFSSLKRIFMGTTSDLAIGCSGSTGGINVARAFRSVNVSTRNLIMYDVDRSFSMAQSTSLRRKSSIVNDERDRCGAESDQLKSNQGGSGC